MSRIKQSRVKKNSVNYEILENGNDFGNDIPGLRNCNSVEGIYISHSHIKNNRVYDLIFSTVKDSPIDFNASGGVIARLYQNSGSSVEDLFFKVLRLKNSSSPWNIEISIDSGDISKSTVGDVLVFDLELKHGIEDIYETVSKIFATNVKTTEATIKWTNPNSKFILGFATQHRKLQDTSNVNWIRTEFDKDEDAILTGLESKTRYEVQVMVIYEGGFSRFSESYFFRTI